MWYVQLNAAYVDGMLTWLDTNLASSTADHNLVVVRLRFMDIPLESFLRGVSGPPGSRHESMATEFQCTYLKHGLWYVQ